MYSNTTRYTPKNNYRPLSKVGKMNDHQLEQLKQLRDYQLDNFVNVLRCIHLKTGTPQDVENYLALVKEIDEFEESIKNPS